MSETKQAPAKMESDHLDFLDDLRESGVTNMFGATPYLKRAFPSLTPNEASEILTHWMDTFGAPR